MKHPLTIYKPTEDRLSGHSIFWFIKYFIQMKRFTPLLLLIFVFTITTTIAQTDVNRDIDITKVYEQVVKDGYGTQKIYLELANEHYFQNNYIDAKKWFEKVFEKEPPTDKKLIFRYKQTLKALKVSWDDSPYISTVSPSDN